MKKHWTAHSIKDFSFRIGLDFIAQLDKKMESPPVSQTALAKKLKVNKSHVSQVFSNPGNIGIETIVKYSNALGLKVAIVAYEDDDPGNTKGPIDPEIFKICWEKANKPRDFWAFQQDRTPVGQQYAVAPISMAAKKLIPRTDLVKPEIMQDSIQGSHAPVLKIA